MHPKTRKILQLLRLRQVLHETMFLCLELYVSIKYTLFLVEGYCWMVWNLKPFVVRECYDKLIWNYALNVFDWNDEIEWLGKLVNLFNQCYQSWQMPCWLNVFLKQDC